MTAVFKLNGAALPAGAVLMAGGNTRLPGGVDGLPASAWYGEPMTAGITLDDPLGTIDVPMWSTFTVDETDATGKERIFTGWVHDRRISRGPSYKEGPARLWSLDITDIQNLFSFDVFRASSAQRPAETDVERITFGLGSYPLGYTPIVDNGRFNTANPLGIGAADFVLQYPVELFQSTAGQCGKNFYGYWDDAAGQISLHYDVVGAGPSAGIALSNVIADVDNSTTFFPFLDAEQTHDPDGVYTDIIIKYLGGAVVGVNQTLVDDISPTEFSPVEWHRTLVIDSSRIGKVATANAQLALNLTLHSEEDVLLSCMVRLPSDKVGEARAGDVISVRFTHIPGLETATDMAIIRRNVVPTEGRTDMYDVHLELANYGIQRSPGGDPTPFPQQNPCDVANVSIVQSAHAFMTSPASLSMAGASWASPPTPGNLLIMLYGITGTAGGDPGVFPTWTKVFDTEAGFPGIGGAGGSMSAYWKIAGASEDTTPTSDVGSSDIGAGGLNDHNCYLIEVAGVDTFDGFTSDTQPGTTIDNIGVNITPTANRVAFLLGMFEVNQATGFAFPITPYAGITELYEEPNIDNGGNPGRWIGYRIIADTTGAYSMGGVENIPGATFDWGAVALSFLCSGSDEIPPGVATLIRDEFIADGDGTTVLFTTKYPYIPGTLKVFVDGVPVVNGLIETDPTLGTFTLDFAPLGVIGDTRAEIVTADYSVGYPA